MSKTLTNYYLQVDNQKKKFLSTDELDINNHICKINPLQYNISSTSTITFGKYDETLTPEQINLYSYLYKPIDFPEYGWIPIGDTNRTNTGSIIRTSDGAWQVTVSNMQCKEFNNQTLDENVVIPTFNYACLYTIDIADIVNYGIYQVDIEFENDNHNEIEYYIQPAIIDPPLPIITSEVSGTAITNINVVQTIDTWQSTTANTITIKTFDYENFWNNTNSPNASLLNNENFSSVYNNVNFISMWKNNLNKALYIKNNSNNNLFIKINKIKFYRNYSYFMESSLRSQNNTIYFATGRLGANHSNIRLLERARSSYDTGDITLNIDDSFSPMIILGKTVSYSKTWAFVMPNINRMYKSFGDAITGYYNLPKFLDNRKLNQYNQYTDELTLNNSQFEIFMTEDLSLMDAVGKTTRNQNYEYMTWYKNPSSLSSLL